MNLSILWHVVLYCWIASEIYVAVATRTRQSGGKVNDRGTMLLLWLAIFGSITAGMWIRGAQGYRLPFSSTPGLIFGLEAAAAAILIIGLTLRWIAILSLGKAFSANVAVRSTQTVRKTGLYRWMRHPSYTGLLLCLFAVALDTCNWISFLIITIIPTASLLYRIHVEEIVLREHFGQEYIDYSACTARLIPGIY